MHVSDALSGVLFSLKWHTIPSLIYNNSLLLILIASRAVAVEMSSSFEVDLPNLLLYSGFEAPQFHSTVINHENKLYLYSSQSLATSARNNGTPFLLNFC